MDVNNFNIYLFLAYLQSYKHFRTKCRCTEFLFFFSIQKIHSLSLICYITTMNIVKNRKEIMDPIYQKPFCTNN